MVITSPLTLVSRLKSLGTLTELRKFNILVVDEAHRSTSDAYTKIFKAMDASCIYFMSGTPFDGGCPLQKLLVIGASGATLHKISNEFLINEGVSQKPLVFIHYCLILEPDFKGRGSFESAYELEKLSMQTSEHRMNAIIDIIIFKEGKQGLLTFIEESHGNFMEKELIRNGISYVFINHKSTDRDYKMDLFKSGKVQILLASMVVREGLNLPMIRFSILAQGGKSKVNVKQLVGRSVRTDGDNETVEIHDFYDDGAEVLSKHSITRLNIYKSEGFDITLNFNKDLNSTTKSLYKKYGKDKKGI
jgi:superfamily II DNA or RNA helicase